jgi:glycosyltransferase involved in cell wall biosynthesis
MSEQKPVDDPPALSVVITSVNGYWHIDRCLHSLLEQRAAVRVEIIVVEASENDTARLIGAKYRDVNVIPLSNRRSIPALRSIGIREAKGDIVVTTKDHCVFDPDWYDRIIEAHGTMSPAAIGGAVENGSGNRLVDRAAYICEYCEFMLPFEARPEINLPGPNVSYRRQLLERNCGDLLDEGVWENVLHARLAERGLALWLIPSLVVYHAKIFGFWEFLGQRYFFGRSFAATRVATAPVQMRLFYSSIALFLPPLYLWRYGRCFLGKHRIIGEFLKTAPLLMIFACAWSVGEFLGYALGDGGASLKVK